MKTYLVTYDLLRQGQDYKNLHNALKQLGAVPGLLSVWFLRNEATAQAIANYLLPHIDGNDRIFVTEVPVNNNVWYRMMTPAAKIVA